MISALFWISVLVAGVWLVWILLTLYAQKAADSMEKKRPGCGMPLFTFLFVAIVVILNVIFRTWEA